jgi:hypothetical protein
MPYSVLVNRSYICLIQVGTNVLCSMASHAFVIMVWCDAAWYVKALAVLVCLMIVFFTMLATALLLLTTGYRSKSTMKTCVHSILWGAKEWQAQGVCTQVWQYHSITFCHLQASGCALLIHAMRDAQVRWYALAVVLDTMLHGSLQYIVYFNLLLTSSTQLRYLLPNHMLQVHAVHERVHVWNIHVIVAEIMRVELQRWLADMSSTSSQDAHIGFSCMCTPQCMSQCMSHQPVLR